MGWQEIGNLAELLSAFGVIISLVYLGLQIRANTRMMKASAGFEATHSWATSNEWFAEQSDDFFETTIRTFDHSIPLTDISELHAGKLGIAFRALFQKLEGQYFLYEQGFLEPELWEKRRMWVKGLIKLPFYKRWWDLEKEQAIYTLGFIAQIETASSIEVVIAGIGRKPRTAK